jgi:hypothetical protein
MIPGTASRGASRRTRVMTVRAAGDWDSLTHAEQEVACLVTEGLTNCQVAERLFLSRHSRWLLLLESCRGALLLTNAAQTLRTHGHGIRGGVERCLRAVARAKFPRDGRSDMTVLVILIIAVVLARALVWRSLPEPTGVKARSA